ncbi:MAG TPA: hypothetical protein VEH29_05420 [Acidimicrobiales bacterium]|nr:hypothetical protein [Acidimicrobiales bacterium]
MPADERSRPEERSVDELVHAAGAAATEFDWGLRASDVINDTRRSPSKRLRRGLAVALLVAAIVAVFVAPLPQLHLFGSKSHGAAGATSTSRPVGSSGGGTSPYSVLAVHFLSSHTGWVVTGGPGTQDRLLVTANGGQSWRDVTPPGADRDNVALISPGPTISGTFLSASTWWIGGSQTITGRITVYETTDGGRTWQQRGRTLPGTADSLFFLKDGHGWLEADNGAAMGWNPVTIYGTSNGALTWTELSKSPAMPAEKGTPGALQGGCDKTGLTFVNNTAGWATMDCPGGAEVLASTNDGGRRWSPVDLHVSPPAGALAWPAVFSSPASGAVGLAMPEYENLVYTTTNGGSSWTAHSTPAGRAVASAFIDVVSPTVWVVSSGTSLYVTADAGHSWSTVRTFFNMRDYEIDFTSAQNGWAWNIDQSFMRHTTNGGRTWSTSYFVGQRVTHGEQ